MEDKKLSLGSWITVGHPSIAEVMATAGFDWLCIDIEHTVIDYNTVQQLIIAIQSKNLRAYVRVGENNQRIIKRVLDAGADGIIVPSVNSLEEAKKAVDAVNYPPLGSRGVGLARAQGYGFDFENYRDGKAKAISLILQIEHIDAISELDQIIGLSGVSGTFIGPYDLSGSIGKLGAFDDPAVKEVLSQYEKVALQQDKFMGIHVVQPDYKFVQQKIDLGYNFIAFSFDAFFLGHAIRAQLDNLKTNNL